METEQNIVS